MMWKIIPPITEVILQCKTSQLSPLCGLQAYYIWCEADTLLTGSSDLNHISLPRTILDEDPQSPK